MSHVRSKPNDSRSELNDPRAKAIDAMAILSGMKGSMTG
jgi:hypothetical protein